MSLKSPSLQPNMDKEIQTNPLSRYGRKHHQMEMNKQLQILLASNDPTME